MRSNTFILRRNVAIAAPLSSAAPLNASSSRADSALAAGLPADVVHDGFASGFQLNAPDMDTARKGAITGRQKSVAASEKARKLCKVVPTFHNHAPRSPSIPPTARRASAGRSRKIRKWPTPRPSLNAAPPPARIASSFAWSWKAAAPIAAVTGLPNRDKEALRRRRPVAGACPYCAFSQTGPLCAISRFPRR